LVLAIIISDAINRERMIREEDIKSIINQLEIETNELKLRYGRDKRVKINKNPVVDHQ
jgi:hypothetical protein